MANTNTFAQRITIGKEAEDTVTKLLLEEGCPVRPTGAESMLSSWLHNIIKRQTSDGDRFIQILRHFPDLDTGKALVQVKTAPTAHLYPAVTIEQDSYEVCRMLHEDYGIPVFIVWDASTDGFIGEWVQNIRVSEPKSRKNGSGTDFHLVYKSQLKPITDFVDFL